MPACVVVVACSGVSSRAPSSGADPEATAVRALTAPPHELVTVDEAVPARFQAAWPASPFDKTADWDADDAIWRLCVGQSSAEDKLQVSVSAAVAGGASVPELAQSWSHAVRWCSDPRFCDDVLTRIDAASSEAHARVLWSMAARCAQRLPAEKLVHEGVPDEAVLAWAEDQPLDVPDSVRAHLLAVVRRNLKTASEPELFSAAWVLSKAKDPKLVADLATLKGQLPPRAASALEPAEPEGREVPETFEEARAKGQSQEWIAAHPEGREQALAALEACAGSDVYGDRLWCTRELAQLDWTRARAAWKERQPEEPWEMALATGLKRFETREDLIAHVRSLGFSPRPDLEGRPFDVPPNTALDVLQSWGRVHNFDAETGMFPNQHDDLLRDLAALGEPVLTEVRFGETAPLPDAMEGPYTLHAWTGGKRLSVGAENFGDWYDVEAVGQLFDSVVAQQGVDLAVGQAYTGDQMVIVFVGPKAGVEALVDQGLILSERAAESMRRGKDAEEQMRRALQGGE